MILIFDPLYRLPRQWRLCGYVLLTIHFARLAAWYGIEQKWGKP